MDKNGIGHTQDTWDEQRERLSAYMDGELPAAEAHRMEAHLAVCEECRRELAELRRLQALLRGLPEPRLPRSFTLPVTGSVPVPAAEARRERETQRRQRPVAARAAQWAGGVAAAAGLALVLGSALAGIGTHQYAGSSAGGAAGSAARSSAGPAATVTSQRASSIEAGGTTAARPTGTYDRAPAANATATAASTGGATGTASATHSPLTAAPYPEASAGDNLPVAPLTGAGLVVAGGALLIGGRSAERRGRR